MRFLFCFFAIALSLAVYPVFLNVNTELIPIWNHVEIDIFNWYRMIFVGFTGLISFYFVKELEPLAIGYLTLLFLSCLLSSFPQTSIFGTPMHHEGLIALMGYVGIYHLITKHGIYNALEKCLDIVVYVVAIVGVMQVIYGNFLNFPFFKLLMPKLEFSAVKWPIYSSLGGPNNLGLFCALFFPYAILKKKYVQVAFLLALAIGSQTRGAWLSMVITTAFISRRYLLYLAIAAVIGCIPIRADIADRARATYHQIHYPLRDGDLAGRVYMWKEALPMLKKTLFVGSGPSTFVLYFKQFQKRGDDIGFNKLVIDRPHNLFINIWQGTGLLSLLILSTIVINLMLYSKDAALKLGVLGFLIAGFFTDSVLSVTPYFLIFLGGLQHEYRNELAKSAFNDMVGFFSPLINIINKVSRLGFLDEELRKSAPKQKPTIVKAELPVEPTTEETINAEPV